MRNALVTGGSRGIGAGIALALARAGADVAINYRRDDGAAREVQAQIEAFGRRCTLHQADVADLGLGDEDLGDGDLAESSRTLERGQTTVDGRPRDIQATADLLDRHPFAVQAE